MNAALRARLERLAERHQEIGTGGSCVRSKCGRTGATNEVTADDEINIVLCPMLCSVGEGRGRSLIAHAVGGQAVSAENQSAGIVVAGVRQKLRFAVFIDVYAK